MASNHVAFITAGGLTNATVAHSLYGYYITEANTAIKGLNIYIDRVEAG